LRAYDARRAALDREYLDGRGAPAQLYWSQRLNNSSARPTSLQYSCSRAVTFIVSPK